VPAEIPQGDAGRVPPCPAGDEGGGADGADGGSGGVMLAMRSRFTSVLQIVAALLLAATAVSAGDACECPSRRVTAKELLEPGNAKLANLRKEAGLFVGRVASQVQMRPRDEITTTFQVMKVVKGDLPSTLSLTGITSEDNSCGLNL